MGSVSIRSNLIFEISRFAIKKKFPASSELIQIDRGQRISREKSGSSPTNLGCKSGGQVCNFDEEKNRDKKILMSVNLY
jgi:hypothetical protein